MLFIILLICLVLVFTITITLYLEKNSPKDVEKNTDDVSVIFDDDKKESEEII